MLGTQKGPGAIFIAPGPFHFCERLERQPKLQFHLTVTSCAATAAGSAESTTASAAAGTAHTAATGR